MEQAIYPLPASISFEGRFEGYFAGSLRDAFCQAVEQLLNPTGCLAEGTYFA